MAMLQFSGSMADDPEILEWIADHQHELGRTAVEWFKVIRASGDDVTELLHDGLLTACVGDYPFAYAGAFKAHVNVGFFYGAELHDPSGILEGTGKRMRHVKVKPGKDLDVAALNTLISASYSDIKQRIANLS